MYRLRIFITFITVMTLITIPVSWSADQDQKGEQFKFPSLISSHDKTTSSFTINFSVIKQVKGNGYIDTVGVPLPFDKLPKPTQDFTNSLIMRKFITKPTSLGDRFYGITLENHKEKVDFFMTLNPLGRHYEFQELWFYYVGVENKGGGKRVPIARLIISQEGNILYGNGNEISEYWAIGDVTRTKDGITIDIVNNRDGHYFGTYLYDAKNKKLEMIRSNKE